ncbi:MAG: glycosyltransferase family 2 protein [bacterium]
MNTNKTIQPELSIIIPTYNRPKVLRYCLLSVLNQSFENWIAYVIGDNCSDSTKEIINAFNDERISYYNNPYRFGEQSGGNSIGIALAETRFIAFLNHDDIWLPNHLEKALQELKELRGNFYVGRSALYSKTKNNQPVIEKASVKNIKPYWTFAAHFTHFEPCSTWVLENSLAQKVGYWKQSVELHRYPIQDFIMRAWRSGAKFIFPEEITCIRMIPHLAIEKNRYSYFGNEYELIFHLIKNQKALNKKLKNKNLTQLTHTKNNWKRKGANRFLQFTFNVIYDIIVNKITAYLYYYTGIDTHSLLFDVLLQKRGAKMRESLKKRTGEDSLKKHDINYIINVAKENLKDKL